MSFSQWLRGICMVGATTSQSFGLGVGHASYKEENVKEISFNGSLDLDKTTVSQLSVNGALHAKGATIEVLQANGSVVLNASSLIKNGMIAGTLHVLHSTIEATLSVSSPDVLVEDSRLSNRLTIKEVSGYEGAYRVYLKNSRSSEIVFENIVNGEVLLEGDSSVGSVQGGVIKRVES